MCSKCRNFTNAPINQKRRRCSYCGTIIDITKANRALFDGPEQALIAVKEFNAARGGDEFQRAVEQSRERFRPLIPDEPVDIEKITSDEEMEPIPGKRILLMGILEEEAKDTSCTLSRLEEICNAKGLDWAWVERTIQNLSNAGVLIFPRPWEIQLVETTVDTSPKIKARHDVSEEIISFLKTREKSVRVIDIIHYFEQQGITEDSVNNSLEQLMRNGDIFQPVVGYVSLV